MRQRFLKTPQKAIGAGSVEALVDSWTGLVSLKGISNVVMIQQFRVLGIVGFSITGYDAQTCRWQPQKTPATSLGLILCDRQVIV